MIIIIIIIATVMIITTTVLSSLERAKAKSHGSVGSFLLLQPSNTFLTILAVCDKTVFCNNSILLVISSLSSHASNHLLTTPRLLLLLLSLLLFYHHCYYYSRMMLKPWAVNFLINQTQKLCPHLTLRNRYKESY